MKITKQQLKQIIKEEKTKVLIEHELRKLTRIDEGKMQDLAVRFGVPLALISAIAAGIEAPTSVDIHATAPGIEQAVDEPVELRTQIQNLYDEWQPETEEGQLYKEQLGELL